MKVFKRKKKGKADRGAAREATANAVRQGLTIAAAALVFGGLAVGVVVGTPRLQAALAERAPQRVWRVEYEWPAAGADRPGTWLPEAVQRDLLRLAERELDRNPDPYSAEGLRRIAEAAAGTGWFDQIESVRREADGVVRVKGVWRTPAAVVRHDGRDFLVSRRGEVLPMTFEEGQSTLRAIVGGRLEPVRVNGRVLPGTVWPGADIRAGLDLLATVSSRPWASQIAAVDVSEYLSRKQLVLVTKRDGRVVWGAGVDETVPGEVSAEAKLKRLDYIQAHFGAVDARHRIVEIAGPRVLVDDTATANAR